MPNDRTHIFQRGRSTTNQIVIHCQYRFSCSNCAICFLPRSRRWGKRWTRWALRTAQAAANSIFWAWSNPQKWWLWWFFRENVDWTHKNDDFSWKMMIEVREMVIGCDCSMKKDDLSIENGGDQRTKDFTWFHQPWIEVVWGYGISNDMSYPLVNVNKKLWKDPPCYVAG